MRIEDEIFSWVRSLEPWEQALFLQGLTGPSSDDGDLASVVSLLLSETDGGEAPQISRDDIPSRGDSAEPMALLEISEVNNVNALASGQVLSFAPVGLTVIYGENAAGKTGYSRIVKHAGRTLHRESVLTNVALEDSVRPSAQMCVKIGARTEPFNVPLDEPAPVPLARICVFDAAAGRRYLTTETEVDYAPAALNSLERLADGLRGVADEIDLRLEAARPAMPDWSAYPEGTATRALLDGLSATTTDADIEDLAYLSKAEGEESRSLERQLGEIRSRNATQLRELAEREARTVQDLLTELEALPACVGSETIQATQMERRALAEAAAALELASQEFRDEPVSGVGGKPWRLLWDTAKAFVEHQGETLPSTNEPGHCPLCMQELGADARKRLTSFDQFVRADVSEKLAEAQKAVQRRVDELPDLRLLTARHRGALELLGGPQGPRGLILDWIAQVEERMEAIRTGALDSVRPLSLIPDEIRQWITSRNAAATHHRALEQAENQSDVARRVREFSARRLLGERRDEILARRDALKVVARLEEVRAKLGTTRVSNKITSLSKAFVEADLQTRLNEQLRALNFNALEVQTKPRTVEGVAMVGLCFKTVNGVPLTDVLSDGEQRRLSLAMFLAEMEALPGSDPIVLDDPVSSIDQEGRRHIARTLVKLAITRQVIVFTHEIAFIDALRRQAEQQREAAGLEFKHVVRHGPRAGHVGLELPWEGLSPKDRIKPLRQKLKTVQEAHNSRDPEDYEVPVCDFCRKLRQAFERIIEVDVFAGTVLRGEDAIHTKKLRQVIWNEDVVDLIDRGMDENSPWVHDRRLDTAALPTPDELAQGLSIYEELYDALNEEKKCRDKAKAKRKQARVRRLQAAEMGETEPQGEHPSEEIPPFAGKRVKKIAPRPARKSA